MIWIATNSTDAVASSLAICDMGDIAIGGLFRIDSGSNSLGDINFIQAGLSTTTFDNYETSIRVNNGWYTIRSKFCNLL